ncbi:cation diffusion facilitator family metal ion transporter-like protein [Hyaloscypha hepaticicola]|uniref:Cation diffusion facilitator family metal ion transporter-like protein n=1 Tax=Hyaloscypha hepaticicola TaxID=2082293 RepID=A0A2J6QLV3_9HELO|nr:cation diffusion facilitator family metal ion transporter-like protein [Hyaloscypha hepaticicola]
MVHGLSKTQRLSIAIGISFTFFAAEISVGFYTHSLALVADAFHYLNDLVGFIVAFAAFKISERENSPKALSFGWQRASLLGSFFNGTFLLALGLSIFLQSLERFVSLQHVQNPMLIMIMGCVGLALNVISVIFLHEHDDHEVAHGNLDELAVGNASENNLLPETTNPHAEHRHKVDVSKSKGHSHDLGMMAVLMHIAGDALNNIGVIIAAAVIWKAKYEGRFYADPAVGMGIAIMITLSGLPIVKRSGQILLESMPLGVSLEDVKHDLEKVSGALSIHELHIWRLSQYKALASAHVFTTDDSLANWMVCAKLINECLHAYGIHSSTLQPELVASIEEAGQQVAEEAVRRRDGGCQIVCGTLCEGLTCCGREKAEAANLTRAVAVTDVRTLGGDVM